MTIELAAPSSQSCDAAAERALRTFFAARANAVFREDDADAWSADVACDREHATGRFQSWRCTFEHSPMGAYPDVQVVGVSALADSAGLAFVEPLAFCSDAARAKVIGVAVRAAPAPAREELQRLQGNGPLSPSTWRTASSLAFSFTDDLPHVLDAAGVVDVPIDRAAALCAASDARAAIIFGGARPK